MKVLLKSAKIIAAQSKYHNQVCDILIEDGTIQSITSNIEITVDKKIEIDNLHVSLGWFDSSVCFGEPGYEERETIENGLLTAAQSGFTAVGLNPETNPVTDSRGLVKYLLAQASTSATKLYPIGALTQKGEGIDLSEMYDMQAAGAVAFGDYKKPILNPNLLKIALEYCQSFDGLVQSFPDDNRLTAQACLHEGDSSIKLGLKGMPAFAEELQLSRDIELLAYTGGKLHIPTISTAGSVERIAKAKEKGLDVTCSVALANLIYTDERMMSFDSLYKVMPPLRSEVHRQSLIEGVKSGVIDMVTTDHCPMNIETKKLELERAAFGTVGLEAAFGMLNAIFGVEETISILTRGRARYHIEEPKLAEGALAELSLFVPNEKHQLKETDLTSQSKNCMFIGEELTGKVFGVFSNNQLILNS